MSKREKFYTCKHSKEVGEIAVYVEPTCPHATKIKGTLVSSKQRCRSCSSYERKEAKR